MNQTLLLSLKKERINNNLKQSDVALILGVKSNTISSWESGRTEPSIDMLVELCRLYKINCGNLLNNAYNANNLSLLQDEQTLLSNYQSLNQEGKEKLLEYSTDLTNLDKYKNIKPK